ncbi:MAG: glycosyltransferase [Deferribacteraceae bacterium]|jgi:glycosyltransferase involved in cell wall biosynthesis|nr:glycosyltransferase [Deferribacteraceae bacterium]
MKILHIDTGREWRGGQRQCALLHQGLLDRGYDSVLLSNSDGALAASGLDNTITMPFYGELNPHSIIKLKNIINKETPSILHSHEAHSLTPLVILKHFGLKFHLIHTRRVDFSVRKNPFSIYKYNYSKLNLVAISQGVKKALVRDGILPERINIIYSGVPIPYAHQKEDTEKIKKTLGLKGYTVFGTVANFSPHKDLPTLLRAFAVYHRINERCKLLMVGDGPLFNATKKLAEDLNISGSVIFTGFRTDVSLLISCMDIFVVSSVLEGLNTSIIDAMHKGLPVIATNTGGIGELTEDGVNGFLVPPKEPDIMAEKMNTLVSSDSMRIKYGANGKEKAMRFTDSAMIEGYINLYNGNLL